MLGPGPTPSHSNPAWNALLLQLFGGRKAPSKRKVLETVVPEPSFAVPAGLAAIAGFAAYEQATPVAVLAGILAAFLVLQATRVK